MSKGMRVKADFYSRASARRDLSRLRKLCKFTIFLLTRLCEARRLRGDCMTETLVFLLTRLCEARPERGSRQRQREHFYSRASARRDEGADAGLFSIDNFYSRASARRDEGDGQRRGTPRQFLLTRLCEARPTARAPTLPPTPFLLTRLCEARRWRPTICS